MSSSSVKGCTFDGCQNKHEAKGLCMAHYTQKYTRGQELKPLRVMGRWTLTSLLASGTPEGDCICRKRKYSQARYQGKNWGIHVLALHLATGEPVAGRVVHHKCANNRCFNPDHLEFASEADNQLEMLARRDYEARIAALEATVTTLTARVAELEEGRWPAL